MVTHDRVALTASWLKLLLLRHVAVIAGKITLVQAHELLLAHAASELIAAVREAADMIRVVYELLVHLLIAQLLRLLGRLWLTHILLWWILSTYLMTLGLTGLRLLIHQLVQVIETLHVLLMGCLRSSLTASVLHVVKTYVSRMVRHHQVA